jgi:hypothetical protein
MESERDVWNTTYFANRGALEHAALVYTIETKSRINGTIVGAERRPRREPVLVRHTHGAGNGEELWRKHHYPVQLLGSLHLGSSWQCLLLMRTLRTPLARAAKAKALLPINAVAAMQSGASAKAEIQRPRHSERCMSDTRLNF